MQHRIDEVPLPSSPARGRLFVTNFSAVGPDPQAALDRVGATSLACMLTDREIELRYPDYRGWLDDHDSEASSPRALRLPTPDGGVTSDDLVLDLLGQIVGVLDSGGSVLVHCGAGMARTAVVGILTMVAFGAEPQRATFDFRAARPGGGPDGPPQEQQIGRLVPRVRRLRPI